MKKVSYIFVLMLAAMLSACSSFLNQEPYDEFTDEEFWQSEDQVRMFMQGFYTSVFSGYGSGYSMGSFLQEYSSLSDDVVSAIDQTNLQSDVIPVSNSSWSFTNVRKANYVIANIDRLDAKDEVRDHWRGVARFYRACYYSSLTFLFGDVPWYDHVVSDADLDDLYKDRDPRTFVDEKILEDFQYAMDNVRQNDGTLQLNKYVVAGMASRLLLREGTYLKYHYGNDAECAAMAEKCLVMARDAALIVMNSGKYSIAPSYKALFTSENLAGNPEVIFYRHYVEGILSHVTLTRSYSEGVVGASKSFAISFLASDGKPVYVKDALWTPRTADEFFANRDPRLSMVIRRGTDGRYIIKGGNNLGSFGYTFSGFSWSKFMDDSNAGSTDRKFTGSNNLTDAPCLRYAEVLLNYAEAAYELHTINASYTFGQTDLDKSINLIRDRADVQLPHLQIMGELPAVGGATYDDPERLSIESNASGEVVSSMLWEIRRERRSELCFEGFRYNDLKRWGRLDYIWNECNPDIRYGAYVVLADYEASKGDISFDIDGATEGWILRNTGTERVRPVERNYISPVPTDQVLLYEAHGYKLTQTKEWQ